MAEEMSPAALDKAAVLAMVSVVGSYTLDALLDWGRRDQLRKQFTERVVLSIGDGSDVDHPEEVLLSNLEWGIDAFEEAIRTTSEAMKITKLELAQKMLETSANLESSGTTAGVQNSYLSAWAHLNLAFVWKVRGNDRTVTNHILEMFLLEPLCSRVDFAPELWEHLFLPHLPSVVNWFMTQRQHIVGAGTPIKSSSSDDMCISRSVSTDSDSASDLHVNVLNFSGEQTAQLQILERLYQGSLDENTRQYAKYYQDWLNADLESNGDGMTFRAARERPPVTVESIADDDEQDAFSLPVSTARSMQLYNSPHEPHEFGVSAASLRKHNMAWHIQSQFKKFNNPEFVDSAPARQQRSRASFQADPNSPTSSIETSHRETLSLRAPSRPGNSPHEASTPPMTPGSSSPKNSVFELLSENDSSWDPIPAMMSLPRLRMPPSRRLDSDAFLGPPALALPNPQAAGHTPSPSTSTSSGSSSRSSNSGRSSSMATTHQPEGSPSISPMRTDPDHPGDLELVGDQLHVAKPKVLKVNHWRTQAEDCHRNIQSSILDGARRLRNAFNQRSVNTSPAESGARFSVFSPVDSRFEFVIDDHGDLQDWRQQEDKCEKVEENLDNSSILTASSHRPSLRFVSRSETNDAEDFEGSPQLKLLEYPTCQSGTESHHINQVEVWQQIDRTRAGHVQTKGVSSGANLSSRENLTPATPLTKPPKDFVCPITGQLFNDPVTLETGQTYERQAIREWIYRGNTTCPITRQTLRINSLPKTNYVLKRLVDTWREQHPELAKDFGNCQLTTKEPNRSPTYIKEERRHAKSGARCSQLASPCSSLSSSLTNSQDEKEVYLHSRKAPGIHSPDHHFGSFSHRDVDTLIMDLKIALTCLCSSEDFVECESVILHIAMLFQEARGEPQMFASLNKAGVIDGMIEVLSKSSQVMVISAILFLLSGLISPDDMTRQTVLNADPELDCLTGLLRKGFILSVVVLYELRLPVQQLISLDLLPLLVVVIKQTEGPLECAGGAYPALHSLMMSPKTAAVMMLEQIVTCGDSATLQMSARTLLVLQAVPALTSHLEKATTMEERTSVVSLLICCLQCDGRSRHLVAQMSNLASVVELLHSGDKRARTIAIIFLNDLARLNRRALCSGILRTVKSEGRFSSLHIVLVHLQMAPAEARPVAAALLLQLDLLDEPRRRSIYRDEAVESLLEALTSPEEQCQLEAAVALVSLGGRFSYTGKSMMEAWLLKTAGLDKPFLALLKDEQDSGDLVSSWQEDEAGEEQASRLWEKRTAGALIGHDEGAIIEALGQGIQSKNHAISRPCLVVAAWISHLLPVLPDTGVRQTARNCLLDHFVSILQSSKDLNDRVLAALAIRGFLADRDGIQEVLRYVRDISPALRNLKKSTWVAQTILKTFITHAETQLEDLWVHTEQGQLDNASHGEVRSLARSKCRMFSGHSDGTIKVWDTRKSFPVLMEEHKQHRKSVTALSCSPNSDRLYSGSLDRSIRVWAIEPEHIRPIHMFELKDAIAGLVVEGPLACVVPHGSGIKVQFEETTSKSFVTHKHVKSVAIVNGKLFCGCTDNSIQEVDPVTGTVDCVQHGIWSLVGKTSMYCIEVFQDHLYAAGSPIDGAAGKVWRLSDRSLVGTLRTTADIRSMAVSEDFIYLGSSTGAIEVWLRERLLKVAILNAGSKVMSLMLDGNTLYSGSDDGRIRVWTMV